MADEKISNWRLFFMVLRDMGVTIVAALVIAGAVYFAGSKYYNGEEDNPAEEFAEAIVENQTGLDIDFTPGSDEEK